MPANLSQSQRIIIPYLTYYRIAYGYDAEALSVANIDLLQSASILSCLVIAMCYLPGYKQPKCINQNRNIIMSDYLTSQSFKSFPKIL